MQPGRTSSDSIRSHQCLDWSNRWYSILEWFLISSAHSWLELGATTSTRENSTRHHHEKTNHQHLHPAIQQSPHRPLLPARFIYSLIGIPMIIFGNQQIKIMGIIYLFMPIIMALLGFIFFAIFAAAYNLLANWLGGFEVVLKWRSRMWGRWRRSYWNEKGRPLSQQQIQRTTRHEVPQAHH